MSGHRIALTGLPEAGKSTLASYLVDHHNFEELTFAHYLKQIIVQVFNVEDKYVYDPEFKKVIIPQLNVTGRELMQKIGTELFRHELHKQLPQLTLTGNSIWIHALVEDIKGYSVDTNIVVSDCRFQNEYDILKSLGFTVVKINRDICKGSSHLSDSGCPYDLELDNNNTEEELYNMFTNIYKL